MRIWAAIISFGVSSAVCAARGIRPTPPHTTRIENQADTKTERQLWSCRHSMTGKWFGSLRADDVGQGDTDHGGADDRQD